MFSQQCTQIDNSSEILARINIKITKRFSSIPVTRADIAKIIKDLDPNMTEYDRISTRMLKVYGNSVLPTFQLIFKSCLESCTFPSEWKKVHVVPEHKKGDKQSLKDYQPISLLDIYGKIFE